MWLMKDWTAPRSAGRGPLPRLGRRRPEGSAPALQLSRDRPSAGVRDSRFLRTLTRRYTLQQQTKSYQGWQALVAAVPQLLSMSSLPDIVPGLASASHPLDFPCERILDAPGLLLDPATNLLAWSQEGTLAVGLCSFAYCWLAGSGEVVSVSRPNTHPVRAVAWHRNAVCLAVSSSPGRVSLIDIVKSQTSRELSLSSCDINAISFANDLLTAGDAQGALTHVDIRMKSCTMKLDRAHCQGVTRVGWNADATMVASGGRDGVVKIWEIRQNGCLRTLQVDAEINGLAWHPSHRGRVAFAGSEVRLYDHCSSVLETIGTNTASVAGLGWTPDGSHVMYAVGNQLHLLNPKTRHNSLITTTDAPILHLSSPAAPTLVTACRDETLLFWQLPAAFVTK